MNGILTWTTHGLYNIVVLLDLKKVSDTVNHEILLRKFEWYGFGNKALDLLSNYLTNRTQRCLPNCLQHTTPRMFADDTSLTAVGKTLNEAEEIANKDLKNVKVWQWCMGGGGAKMTFILILTNLC
jgi:hypothetical protein